jgi:hypothetical protein
MNNSSALYALLLLAAILDFASVVSSFSSTRRASCRSLQSCRDEHRAVADAVPATRG